MKRALFYQGFTLIELILYMTLSTTFLIIVSQIFLATLDVQSESESYVATELDGRYILSRITNDIHRASSIPSPPSAGTASSLALTIDGASYQYATNGSDLRLVSPLGVHVLNSVDTTVSDFRVVRVGTGTDAPSIQVTVTLQAKTVPVEGVQIKTYETTARLR